MTNHTTQPNVLFILSDDHGAWALGCAGNAEIETPNLDRLAASGMRFENFFCTSPVCSPARASLLTGKIPSQHGVHDWLAAGNTTAQYEPDRNGQLIEYLSGQVGYTELLAQAGYACGLSGKWHLGDSHHPQKGIEFWEVHAKGGGPYYNAPMIKNGAVVEEEGYVTDIITDNALRWLDQQKPDVRPFYLGVHYTAPHSPWGRDQHPTQLYDHYHRECAFASVPDGLTPPEWVRYLSIPVEDAATRRAHLAGYYAAVTAMDQNIGRLLDWLEANGQRENTLVIFTSDNGMNMGHHGVYGKGNATFPLNMFEESVKVPFIASQPGQIPVGVLNGDLLSQYDFMPTLLDYVGIEHAEAVELPGRSFAPILRGAKVKIAAEQVVVYDEYGPVRMIRTADWKYVHRYAFGPNELYHLADDPGELHNLAGQSQWAEVENEMHQRLGNWFARYVEPVNDGTKFVVTGSGQIGRCAENTDAGPAFLASRVEHLL
ncbi:MAG: sulfatase-like hydrolase/transferase [Caldilineaceae bacterium]